MSFLGHHEVRPGLGSDGAVSGGVGEKIAGDADELPGGRINNVDRDDFVALGVRFVSEVFEIEIDVLFGLYDLGFEVVLKFFNETGGIARIVGEFFDDLAEVGEFAPFC